METYTEYLNNEYRLSLTSRKLRWARKKADRRRMRIRKFMAFGSMAVLTILCILFFVIVFSAHAQAKEDKTRFKYYTAYEVQFGDTLSSIAEEHSDGILSTSDYIREVRFSNCLKSADSIREGQILHIPYYSTEIK